MTPTLFDLPLRLGDAAAIASILMEQLGVRRVPVTDEVRTRVAARAGALKFESMKLFVPSLERDPVHPSAYYVCVDGVDNQPLLLRVAPASTPSSGIFPKAILIGRTHIASREMVLNAIPFAPEDRDRILKFSEDVNRTFQPRTSGSRPLIRVRADVPRDAFPLAFEGFRKLLRSTGQNQAAFALDEDQDAESFYFTAVWAAIRTGWREGYALEAGVRRRPFEAELSSVTRDVRLTRGMSREEVLGQF